MSREAERERLAVAMGWELRDWNGAKEWFKDGKYECNEEDWNPFETASDLLELMEWVRTQPWFLWFCVEGNELVHTVQIDYLMPFRKKAIGDGPLQEAFPLAVLAVLEEMKAETD